MPKATAGVLIEIDVATKIHLMEEKQIDFVIMDIDDRHLFIKEAFLDFVKEKVTKFKEESKKDENTKVASREID